ncbi:MAG: DNA gyrase inhibitor YacG [Betaproteobacteria bacterium]
MDAPRSPPRTVSCPRCANAVAWSAENRYRPFCSERCKMVDLGAWANEEYRVAAVEQEDEVGDSDEGDEK